MKRLVLLLVLLLLGIGLALFCGAVKIPLSDLGHLTQVQQDIIWQLRLPRMLNAFLVGGCLATAGALLQGVLQNPLADPYILGISAGAGLGVAVLFLFNFFVFSVFLPFGAFGGAVLAVFATYFIVKLTRNFSIYNFIMAGIIVNTFLAAVTMLIVYFSKEKFMGLMFWFMGNLANAELNRVVVMILLSVLVVGYTMFLAYQLNIVSVGDSEANAVGINVAGLRKKVFFIASFLTGIAVASGGVIGFVGLVIPHMVRLLFKYDFRVVIPVSYLLGGIFLIYMDTISRSLFNGFELPVGILTAFIGAPFFLWLMITRMRKSA